MQSSDSIEIEDIALEEQAEKIDITFEADLFEQIQSSEINQTREKYETCLVAGETGSGKSSLINVLFNVQCDVGMGGCTPQNFSPFKIKECSTKVIDSSGHLTLNFQQQIDRFKDYGIIVVVYESSLKSIADFVKFLIKEHSHKLLFVRSKCDLFHSNHRFTIDQQIIKDVQLLLQWGLEAGNVCMKKASAIKCDIFENIEIRETILKKTKPE